MSNQKQRIRIIFAIEVYSCAAIFNHRQVVLRAGRPAQGNGLPPAPVIQPEFDFLLDIAPGEYIDE